MGLCDPKKIVSVIFITFLLSIALIPLLVEDTSGKGDDSGVSVINVAPNINDAELEKKNQLYNLEVIASDFNGWQDILNINITILNKNKEILASGGYSQYKEGINKPTPNGRIDRFENYEGEPLFLDRCSVRRNISDKQTVKKTRMEIDFSFYVEGSWTILLNITDTRNLFARMEVTFPSIMSGIYNFSPFFILIALSVSITITYIKFKDVKRMEVVKSGKG